MLKKTLMFVLVMLFPVMVFGATVTTFSWDAPTTYADTTALDPLEIQDYTVSCMMGLSGVSKNVGNVTTTGISTVFGTAIVADGKYNCTVTVKTIWGAVSDPSTGVTILKKGATFLGPISTKPSPAKNWSAQ